MPAEQRGFLFRFFDKAICAVAVLGLIAVLLYVFALSTGEDLKVIDDKVADAKEKLRREKGNPPPDNPVENLQAELEEARLVGPPPAGEERWDYGLALDLGTRKVGLEEEYTIDLKLASGEVLLESLRPDDIFPRGVEVVHPYQGDYRKALMRTGKYEGRLRLTGAAKDRDVFLIVVVDGRVGARPDAPLDVRSQVRSGAVEITFKPNLRNQERGIRVKRYELQRKELGTTAQVFRAVQRAGFTEDKGAGTYSLLDASVRPNHTYAYTVVAVAPTSEPTRSEPTDVIEITAQPDVDFRLVGGRVGKQVAARFEAVTRGGRANYKQSFSRSVGDEIGDVLPPEYEVRSFRTGCYLVAYHSNVMRITRRWMNVGSVRRELRPKMAVRNRVVYADARGALQVLWKGDENVPYLWKGSVPVRKRKKGSLPDRPGRLLPDGFGGQPDFRGPDGPPSTPEEMQERMRERGSN